MNTSPSAADLPSGLSSPFSLLTQIDAAGSFRVHRVRGRETLSRPYVFDVTVSLDPRSELLGIERHLLGQSVALLVRVGGPARTIHGVVTAVTAEGVRHGHGAQYRVRVEPRFALLDHERTSCIFQDMTVPDVVRSVLASLGIPSEWRLTRVYPVRPFITQYRESSRAFVERLLAEAGIFYAFAHPLSLLRLLASVAGDFASGDLATGALHAIGDVTGALLEREVMVFGDGAGAYLPIEGGQPGLSIGASVGGDEASVNLAFGAVSPTLRFVDRAGLSSDGSAQITALTRRQSLRSNRAHFRDYDPDRPQLALVSTAPALESVVDGWMDTLPAPMAAAAEGLIGTALHTRLETYEHGGDHLFPDWQHVQAEAAVLLRARRRRSDVSAGASRCAAISPGFRFTLDAHPVAELNQEYTVVSVRHRGAVGRDEELYSNVFECVPATTHYPPARPARRCVQASHTATVVGPAGEEVHVDEWGRIKVHFHWDRRGGGDTSCWLRTMQAWGGEGWGTQFIPRVGMEVVVVFEGGDPDCPIVLGCVGNRTHPPAFNLPGDKTRSGIRTKTYKGEGHNELSFQDATAKEQIFLHAQRDLDEVVENDHTLAVKADESLRVHGDRTDHVQKTVTYSVGGTRKETVDGDVTVSHKASRVDVVTKDLDQRVGGVRTTRVATRDHLEVQGPAEHRFSNDVTTRVEGNATLIVGQHDARRSLNVHVEGGGTVSTTDALELLAQGGLTLRCGKTTLRITEDGIELSGGSIRVASEKGGVEVDANGVKLLSGDGYAHLDDKIVLRTKRASLSMGDEVKLDGSRILLNAPDKAKDPPALAPEPPTEIILVDKQGNPLPNQRFLIELAGDAGERCGVTDKDGKARIDLASGGKIRFPDLSEVSC